MSNCLVGNCLVSNCLVSNCHGIGLAITCRCERPVAQVNFYLYFYAIQKIKMIFLIQDTICIF